VDKDGEWELKFTGIPVLVLDRGETRNRTCKRIEIILSEKGTAFTLWKNEFGVFTNYQAKENNFHTMRLSNDPRWVAGLSFDDVGAAEEFYEKVSKVISDPQYVNGISLKKEKASMRKARRKADKSNRQRYKMLKKSDISLPCCFIHVTNVEPSDRKNYVTLTSLIPEETKA
jgi:hypothetical protein